MCGITGFYVGTNGNFSEARLNAGLMQQALFHRGPDNGSEWLEDSHGVGLFHRMLSIIGHGAASAQPMASADGRFRVSFNGELYNYLELADLLELPVDSAVRQSDTAVFVNAIAKWGLRDALTRSVGMFAFALWDERSRELTLVRDPAGKRPLYFGTFGGCFYFASEIAAFRSVPQFELSINEKQLSHYLSFGFVPSPETIFTQVRMLGAGELMTISAKLESTTQRYHDFLRVSRVNVSFPDAVSRTEELFDEAVRLRLRADVPLGCFLSGGIDSGLIVASAARQLSRPLKTFTIAIQGSEMDEGPLARETARLYATDHHEILLQPKISEALPRIINSYGQPFADASAVPAFLVAEAARRHVTVVLNGDGADEIFGGYRRQTAYRWAQILSVSVAKLPRAGLEAFVRLLPLPQRYRSSYAFMHRFLRGLHKAVEGRYLDYCMDGFSEEEKILLFPRLRGASSVEFLRGQAAAYGRLDATEQMLALDFFLTLHDDMLIKSDIASMTHSLEARCPFLDKRLVDWCFSLPAHLKIGLLQNKPILRTLAKKNLPAAVAGAPKRGFEIPIATWLRGELQPLVRDSILNPNGIVRSLASERALLDLIEKPEKLDPDRWSRRVWTLLVLSLWDKGSL